uniref:Protein translocase subunit SecE n=1 Tax=uncultured marine group II/III euryarchaeote AD1000_66_E09 TaxID=1457798 RepID=A0A075FVY4_9EURY|nr:hypothetical protein [uncultured marine group II/III euryarchaeote AD1000_66_E09]
MPRSSNRRSRRRRQTRTPGRSTRTSQTPTPQTDPPSPHNEEKSSAATVSIRPRRATPRPVQPVAQSRGHGRLYRWTHPRYFIEIIDELRKVVWPSREETRNLTTVVIIVAIAVGALLGGVDWGFNRILENVLVP